VFDALGTGLRSSLFAPYTFPEKQLEKKTLIIYINYLTQNLRPNSRMDYEEYDKTASNESSLGIARPEDHDRGEI